MTTLHVHRHLLSEEDADAVHLLLARDDKELVALFQHGIRSREEDLFALHDAGNDKVTAELAGHVEELAPENGGILHGDMHPAGLSDGIFRSFERFQLFLGVDPEKGPQEQDGEDHAEYADRIGDGITGSQRTGLLTRQDGISAG